MTLQDQIRDGSKIQAIAEYLDGLAPEARAAEVLALGGREQSRLYALAADAPPIDRRHFVPDDTPARQPVIHEGRNSQPAFRRFQKRFCRPEDGTPRLFGYNEAGIGRLIGPGYFVAHDTEEGDPRGAVVVDYFEVPDGPVAAGWPPVVPNRQGLQRFVYHQTRDYMRRVSIHVAIGQAIRLEKRVMGYFVLCRRD